MYNFMSVLTCLLVLCVITITMCVTDMRTEPAIAAGGRGRHPGTLSARDNARGVPICSHVISEFKGHANAELGVSWRV